MEIIQPFEKCCEIIRQAADTGDFCANNQAYATVVAIFKKLENNPALAQVCLPQMLLSENLVAEIQAAAYCLALKMNQEQAVRTLEKIADDKRNGALGFDAEMTLKEWQKRGCLRIY